MHSSSHQGSPLPEPHAVASRFCKLGTCSIRAADDLIGALPYAEAAGLGDLVKTVDCQETSRECLSFVRAGHVHEISPSGVAGSSQQRRRRDRTEDDQGAGRTCSRGVGYERLEVLKR